MPEFLTLLPPDQARQLLLSHLKRGPIFERGEWVETSAALGRTLVEDIVAPQPLPDFQRSTVDGYAVRARDTYGASDSLPAYLALAGEIPMGAAPAVILRAGECALIHTGGMLPDGADAVVMLELTQRAQEQEIEIFRAVAVGENVIRIGEDVVQGQVIKEKGSLVRPADVGGLMALGITKVRVVKKARAGLISTGDEIIDPAQVPQPGQVRDVNSYTLAALIERAGGIAQRYGVVPDQFEVLLQLAARALSECDLVIITAGSSASTRDRTAEVISSLGAPGVLVHGINTRPGKPTILGVCAGKPVIGLPGNPVSALVNGYLFVVPVLEKLMGARPRPHASTLARLTVNLASQAGREDWWPVRLISQNTAGLEDFAVADQADSERNVAYLAEPIFGKSNLIFTLASADGLLRIAPDATGISAGEIVRVYLL